MENPSNIAFVIFGRPVYWYGVLMAVGIVLAVCLAWRESKRKDLPKDTILDLCLVLIPSGIIGARIFYVLFKLDLFLQNPIRMLYIWEGGLAIYGAVIFGLLGAFLYARKKRIRFLKIADIIAPGLVLAQAIGRWGNFFNQEAFGLPVTDPNLRWFPLTVYIDKPHVFDFGDGLGEVICQNPYHLATFFYESLWCVLVFVFLWAMRKRFKHDGDAFLWYAMLYSFARFFIEPLRGDSLWLIQDVIRVSQGISAVVFVAVLAFFVMRRVKEKQLGCLVWPKPLRQAEGLAQEPFAENAFTAETQEEEGVFEAEHLEEEPSQGLEEERFTKQEQQETEQEE